MIADPLELATRLFGPEPPWPTPIFSHGRGPVPVDNDAAASRAWGAMRAAARDAAAAELCDPAWGCEACEQRMEASR